MEENIKLARDFISTGNYEEADKRLKAALAIDPYNKAAAIEQKKLMTKIRKSNEIATQSSRQEKLTQVREGWMEVYKPEGILDQNQGAAVVVRGRPNFALSQKLQSIIIPEVSFSNASIKDAVDFLTIKSREQDPTGVGINFLIRNDKAREEAKNFNLKLKNVPAAEVLRYVCALAGVKSKVEEFAVFIVPLSETDQVLVSREFPVRESFFDVEGLEATDGAATPNRRRTPGGTTTTAQPTDPIKEALQARGVRFPDGATAIYNNSTGILTVRNTQDQIDLVEELVTENQGEALLVRIETKLVEIRQKDLDSLSFNYNLAGSSSTFTGGGSQFNAGSIAAGTNLLGAQGILETDGINRIINVDPAIGSASRPSAILSTPNRFGISGLLDGNAFAALMESLSQKESTDLVTAPSLLVNDGSQGTVEVAREFFYPTEFDQAQASVEISDDTATFGLLQRRVTIVPSWPTSFEKRNVGVTLNVQPRVTVDRKRVYLVIKPDVVEFDGFINYGARIFGDPDIDADGVPLGAAPVLNENVINQPVFSIRTVENAQMEIQDGYTMVLGGLIREDISTVEDKVPILGDIPWVGRLFRSKAEQAVKNNLLIFVTVRILRPDGEPFNVETATALK
ncbi:MAG: hypothetical protein HC904_07935 [Blastochloris sp.]|nr:hypothetical protein [Blastochloris sp.]